MISGPRRNYGLCGDSGRDEGTAPRILIEDAKDERRSGAINQQQRRRQGIRERETNEVIKENTSNRRKRVKSAENN